MSRPKTISGKGGPSTFSASTQRRMWDALHKFAAGYQGNSAAAATWLVDWESRFPEDCPCRKEWHVALGVCAPPLGEPGLAFFWWTVALHDRINVLLDKPVWLDTSKMHPLVGSLQHDAEAGAVYISRLRRPAVNRSPICQDL